MHETWGISGPAFLAGYAAVAVVVVAGTGLYRHWVIGGHRTAAHLTAQNAAYLAGGPQLATYAAIGSLVTASALGRGDGRTLSQTGPVHSDATSLDRAVYDAVRSGAVDRLRRDGQVAAELERFRRNLEQSGLSTSRPARAWMRLGLCAMVIVAAAGAVRIAAGIVNGKPVGWLVATVAAVTIFTVIYRRAPTRTHAGDAELRMLRRRNQHLSPSRRPSFTTYGPAAAAMGVALFGTGALYALDTGLAMSAGIPRDFGMTAAGHEGARALFGNSASSCASGGGASSCGGGGSGGGGGCGG